MFVIEARKRTDRVSRVRWSVHMNAKSFKEAESKFLATSQQLSRRSGKVKPGQRIESISFSDRENIYLLKKSG